jgi:predicted DNA-binding protein
MNPLSIKLPRILDKRLEAEAKKRNKTKAAIILEALHEYLAKQDETEPVTAYDLAKDFIGCGAGPSDLSTNKRHMEGYGQ